jgi:hypothetical protein
MMVVIAPGAFSAQALDEISVAERRPLKGL